MPDATPSLSPDQKTGKVTRIMGEYGFIASPDVADQDVYFKSSWFRDSPPLREGDSVTFQLKRFGDNLQANNIRRAAEDHVIGAPATFRPPRQRGVPTGYHIFDWAYLGYLPNVLSELAGLALRERWNSKMRQRTLNIRFLSSGDTSYTLLVDWSVNGRFWSTTRTHGQHSTRGSSTLATNQFMRFFHRTTIRAPLGNWPGSASRVKALMVKTLSGTLHLFPLEPTTSTIRLICCTTQGRASPNLIGGTLLSNE